MTGLMAKVKDIINFFYYWKISSINNIYPYKLLGQKIDPDIGVPIIIFKVNGIYHLQEVALPNIICNLNLIEKFHPFDAMKMGEVAFNDTINNLPVCDREQKFRNVCKTMVELIYDISYKLTDFSLHYKSSENYSLLSYPELKISNTYWCKLIDAKLPSKDSKKIKILFKIFSRREGHEIELENLMNDKKLIAAFHPTDVFKLGYLASGELMLKNLEENFRDS